MKTETNPKVDIISFKDEYATDFGRLNFEWLRTFFYIEPYDEKVLNNPKKYIINSGGYIFFALVDTIIVGTVALIKRGERDYELSKMGVAPNYQGLRIGQKLMYHCIDFGGKQGWSRLFLDSNTKLTPAISLYKKVGFSEIPVPSNTPYERCNIRMELKL